MATGYNTYNTNIRINSGTSINRVYNYSVYYIIINYMNEIDIIV